jgi:superfamily II DNA or RNA helicase
MKKCLNFIEARSFVKQLQLKNKSEWQFWAKTAARPSNIPANPPRSYKNEWVSWGDWLGTNTIANRKKEFLSFEEARNFARSLKFQNQKQWARWAKTNDRSLNMPSYPNEAYCNEWVSWGDWLGTNTIANRKKEFLSFEEARNFARSLKFQNHKQWERWAKTDDRPLNMPANPSLIYKNEWISWGDWFGTHIIASKNKEFLSFEEARNFVHSLQLKSKSEWMLWTKTANRPNNIPTNPSSTYKNGWIGWGDWLGTYIIAPQKRQFLSFEEARNFVHALRLKNTEEWYTWRKTSGRPSNIPADPSSIYKNQWAGWADWLGITNIWTIASIRAFVSSILPYLENLSPAGLYVLFLQTGILEITPGSKGRSFVQALKTGKFPKQELEKFIDGQQSLVDEFFANSEMSLERQEDDITANSLLSDNKLSIRERLIEEDLPNIETKGILATLDSKLFSTLDNEAVDFFVKEAVARIWQHAFSDEAVAIKQLKQYGDEGTYSQEVKRLFLDDYHGAKNLSIPVGYNFCNQPFLMQIYTAYLIKSRKRLGNWSGTGAGKTLSAILASRVIQAGLTVICCPNNVVSNWKRNILEIYPESSIFVKDTDLHKDMFKRPKYLILNYEFFQQSKAKQNLKALVDNNIIDFIIIDEIHFSKQREVERISLRKATISAFLSEASAKNEELHVLGMSATPVINNLFEGKTLIEMVTGVQHNELNTKSTVSSCIALYQKFISHGIRCIPEYNYQLNIQIERIDCKQFLSEIKHQSTYGSMVDLEAVLTKAKLPFILDSLKPKTIVYTHYIKNILPILQEAIANQGWQVAVFTGEEKDGLEAFVEGDADILIASSCIGTGVDGLQRVCNRLIINSLPWTHAEFEQLKGRIYRHGQVKNHVDVLIPLTYAQVNEEEWSWCNSRWKRIQFKKSIADAAIDGVIPEGYLRTPAQAYKDAMLWLKRLDRGEIYEVQRDKITVSLREI